MADPAPSNIRFSCFFGVTLALICALFPLAVTGAAHAAPVQRSYLVFGFLPVVSSERLARRFMPLVEHLSGALGVEVRMETAPGFREFIHRTQHETRYDILFTAPHLYYLAQHQRGYRALVRIDQPGMTAVIVAPRDSAIGKITDLRGRRLATVDPLALATMLSRESLLRAGLDPDSDLTLVATPSHNASLLSSWRGITDASVIMKPLYLRARPDILAHMKVIGETDSSPHMPISVAPWVDAVMAERLAQALLGLSDSDAGQELLRHVDWPGFTRSQAGEYESMGREAMQSRLQ